MIYAIFWNINIFPQKVVGSEKDTENIREKLDSAGSREADLIYFLPDGVQLFTINASFFLRMTEAYG